MCLHLCIVPLVACPGLWLGDIAGPCAMVSVPPMCTQAFYWNAARQRISHEKLSVARSLIADAPAASVFLL